MGPSLLAEGDFTAGWALGKVLDSVIVWVDWGGGDSRGLVGRRGVGMEGKGGRRLDAGEVVWCRGSWGCR